MKIDGHVPQNSEEKLVRNGKLTPYFATSIIHHFFRFLVYQQVPFTNKRKRCVLYVGAFA